MNTISATPNPSGAYPSPQTWPGNEPPEGYAVIPDELDMSDFYTLNGFVTLTIEDGAVTDYAPNTEARETWLASLPEPTPPEPTLDERVTQLTAQLKASIQSNAMLEECLVEMAEIVYA